METDDVMKGAGTGAGVLDAEPGTAGVPGAFPSLVHVAMTVTDLGRSVPWYSALFAADPERVTRGEDVCAAVWSLSGTTVVLHEFVRSPSEERFDELRPGLDHLGFGCADRVELEKWATRLDALGVGHAGIVDAPYGSGLAFRDPDNIALEFFAPPV